MEFRQIRKKLDSDDSFMERNSFFYLFSELLLFQIWRSSILIALFIKVAGVKVYPRQTWNFRSHAVSACSNHVIGPWHHRLMHATQADRGKTCLYGMYCMHCLLTSQADACRYCIGSKVSSLSLIYLYSSCFAFYSFQSIDIKLK